MRYNTEGDVKQVVSKAVEGYKKGQRGVQNAAVCILIHAYQHGDYSQAQVLCDGVGSKQLVEWFKDFGGLIVTDNKFSGWSGKEFIAESFKSTSKYKNGIAKDTMYWEYKKPNIWGGQDDLAAAKKLIKSHNDALAKVVETPEFESKFKRNDALIAGLELLIQQAEAA